MLPPIKGFLPSTLLDWEGKITAVIFLPSCNFRCSYCHAGHLISEGSQQEGISLQSILNAVLREQDWIDGIVISGGEPTLHPGLPELIQAIRQAGLGVKLDTNGSRPDVLQALLEQGLLDYVAMDAKAPLDERYSQIVNAPVDLDDIRASIEMLIGSNIGYEFRTTICPTQLTPDDVVDIAQAVRGADQLFLQSFRPLHCLDPTLHDIKPYTGDALREMATRCAKYVRRCMVRGDAASELVQAE